MPLHLGLSDGYGEVPIDEQLFFDDLPGQLQFWAPTWKRLGERCMDDDFRLELREVETLASEVRGLRKLWVERHRDARRPYAPVRDRVAETFDRVLEICDRAIAAGGPLFALTD